MAGTTYFDELLNADINLLQEDTEAEKNLKLLVPVLKIAVQRLRNNQPLERDLARYLNQQIELTGYMKTTNGGEASDARVQHDPADFFRALLGDWQQCADLLNAHPELPTSRSTYKPVGHENPKAPRTDVLTLINVPINEDQIQLRADIHLDRATAQKAILDVNDDNDVLNTFRKKDIIDVPTTSRAIFNILRSRHDGKRANNSLHINYDKRIKLSKGDDAPSYLVKGALIQSGSANSGHWVYLEANADGCFYLHDDENVTECPQGKADSKYIAGLNRLKQGTIFFLEKEID
jgi:hypothetical protein